MPETTRKRTWSKIVEKHGIKVRLYTRPASDAIYREVRIDGRKKRKSLKHTDRELAESQAEELAKSLAEMQLLNITAGATLGQVLAAHARHRVPDLSEAEQQRSESTAALFLEAWGRDQDVDDIGQQHVDRYARLRKAGELSPLAPELRKDSRGKKRRVGRKPVKVRTGTIVRDLQWLSSCFNWARKYKVNGKRLVSANPLADVDYPEEKNPRRPVASHDRYLRTQEHTDAVDPKGRIRAILATARYAGRRESAICQLWASDVLLSRDAIAAALAEAGMDERLVEHMPHGALRWREDSDKMGFFFVSPISRELRAELERYLRLSPRIGDVPLFPAPNDPERSIRREAAYHWLIRAEELAELPKLTRGAFHPYRRLWASERKHLPDVDVAEAGGWRDLEAMKQSYQQADPHTVLKVVQNGS